MMDSNDTDGSPLLYTLEGGGGPNLSEEEQEQEEQVPSVSSYCGHGKYWCTQLRFPILVGIGNFVAKAVSTALLYKFLNQQYSYGGYNGFEEGRDAKQDDWMQSAGFAVMVIAFLANSYICLKGAQKLEKKVTEQQEEREGVNEGEGTLRPSGSVPTSDFPEAQAASGVEMQWPEIHRPLQQSPRSLRIIAGDGLSLGVQMRKLVEHEFYKIGGSADGLMNKLRGAERKLGKDFPPLVHNLVHVLASNSNKLVHELHVKELPNKKEVEEAFAAIMTYLNPNLVLELVGNNDEDIHEALSTEVSRLQVENDSLRCDRERDRNYSNQVYDENQRLREQLAQHANGSGPPRHYDRNHGSYGQRAYQNRRSESHQVQRYHRDDRYYRDHRDHRDHNGGDYRIDPEQDQLERRNDAERGYQNEEYQDQHGHRQQDYRDYQNCRY